MWISAVSACVFGCLMFSLLCVGVPAALRVRVPRTLPFLVSGRHTCQLESRKAEIPSKFIFLDEQIRTVKARVTLGWANQDTTLCLNTVSSQWKRSTRLQGRGRCNSIQSASGTNVVAVLLRQCVDYDLAFRVLYASFPDNMLYCTVGDDVVQISVGCLSLNHLHAVGAKRSSPNVGPLLPFYCTSRQDDAS